MTSDVNNHHLVPRLVQPPADPDVTRRMPRLRELGLGTWPDQESDEFARKLAHTTDAPFAMVNLITESQQYFAGLYVRTTTPSATQEPVAPGPAASGDMSRVMSLDQGFCPHVVARRRALVLDDVYEMPRFAGNRVVDEFGIRSYLGAPLIDHTDTVLGTICVIDTQTRPWGRPGLDLIKRMAGEMMDLLNKREKRP